jgi:hypothetical protein
VKLRTGVAGFACFRAMFGYSLNNYLIDYVLSSERL